MKALAIAAVRDEAVHVRNLVGGLIADGLDVVLLDHGSTDGTAEIASEFLGKGLLEIRDLPWHGRFSLEEQLEAKFRIARDAEHDWIVHVDADEWLCAPRKGQRLLDAIEIVDALEYNCINFREFVFVPLPGEDLHVENYRSLAKRYYLYQPERPFLLRAWRRDAALDNRAHGGHLLDGNARVFPIDFIMRHYIVLNETHAGEKYRSRPFSRDEVARGWHADKVLTSRSAMRLPDAADPAFHLDDGGELDASEPRDGHFWQWGAHLDDAGLMLQHARRG